MNLTLTAIQLYHDIATRVQMLSTSPMQPIHKVVSLKCTLAFLIQINSTSTGKKECKGSKVISTSVQKLSHMAYSVLYISDFDHVT